MTVTYSLEWANKTSCCEDEGTAVHPVGLALDTWSHLLLPLVAGMLCSLRGLLVHILSLLGSEPCGNSHLAQSVKQAPDRAWNDRFPGIPHSACSNKSLAIPECTSHNSPSVLCTHFCLNIEGTFLCQ